MMRIKTYFVTTVDEAMVEARQELGPDALLLNTRRLIEGGKSSGYEVVIGINEEPKPKAEPILVPVPVLAPERVKKDAPADETNPLAIELRHLRSQMDEIQHILLSSSRRDVLFGRTAPELNQVYSSLLAAQVDVVLSKDAATNMDSHIETIQRRVLRGVDRGLD